jgi:signal transduction histidine kinase
MKLRMKPPHSIRTRLSALLLLAAVATALVLGAATYRHTLQENEELFDYQLRQIALSLRDQGVVVNPASGREDETPDVVIQIWTSDGAMLYLSRPGDPLFSRATLGYTDVDAGHKRWRVFSMAGRDRVIQVAQALQLRRDLAAAAALRSLTPLLAFAPLMALLIWWLVGTSLAPLKKMAGEVARRDARSLEHVAADDLPSELAPLPTAINARSPLTALKLQLQLLGRAADDAARAEALDQLNQGVDRAAHLIEQLLAAAQTDPNDSSTRLQNVDLVEAARQTLAEIFIFAQQRQIAIALEAPARLEIMADAASLHILSRTLLDNAIRYTPAGGQVRVSVAQANAAAVLTVEDSGPGIAADQRKRVFDRFYRGQQHQQLGSGLGLAIVRNIAEQHRAALELGDSALGGLKVTVAFPALK